MQLDKFTDYGLRIMMTLAVRSQDRMSVAAIAQVFEVSEHHLSKIATRLAEGAFILSERGRNGGLTLARDADQITVGSIVRWLRRNDPVVECFGTNTSCRILPFCGLRDPLVQAQEAFFKTLDSYTLTDVTAQKTQLSELLTPAS